MANLTLNRIMGGLQRKREALARWRRELPAEKKSTQLGPASEVSVSSHLTHIDESLEAAQTGALGICEVCHTPVEPQLLEVDYTACVCLDHLSPQEVSRLENEIELATTVQKALLPQQIPAIPGLEIAAYSRPAQFVGGDYFDFVGFRPNLPGLMIADIAGHGISASLQMASIQALSRAIIPASGTPMQAIAQIHSLFVHNINFTTFVTFFLAAYDPASRKLVYANGGHNPPVLVHSGKSNQDAMFLEPTGPAVGLIEDARYSQQEINLRQGDMLVMYTDGVVEAFAPDGSMFGQDRLVSAACDLAHLPAVEVVRGIRERLDGFIQGRPLEDDVTFVVTRVV